MTDHLTTATAFVLGLATSIHCVGMCGPIACGLGTMARSEGERLVAASAYHGCRLIAYAAIGTICGAIGSQPLKHYFHSPAVVLPWMMVLVLVLMASGLDKRIPRPAVLTRFTARARLRAMRMPAWASSSLMGLLTPFIPCTPLYGVFAVALVAGSAVKGAELLLAFGVGTVPLLWVAQYGFAFFGRRFSPKSMGRVQRGLALITALVLAMRLHGTIPDFKKAQPASAAEPQELPSCCHGAK